MTQLTFLNALLTNPQGTRQCACGSVLIALLLSGTLPPCLGLLPQLSRVWLGHNALSGTIPASIFAGLALLTEWSSDYAGFYMQQFPTEIANLGQLQFLRHDAFNGTFPATMPSSLTTLDLEGSQMSGPFPTWVPLLTGLTTLNLHQSASSLLSGTSCTS